MANRGRLPLVRRGPADRDIDEALGYYFDISESAAESFVSAIECALAHIQRTGPGPTRWDGDWCQTALKVREIGVLAGADCCGFQQKVGIQFISHLRNRTRVRRQNEEHPAIPRQRPKSHQFTPIPGACDCSRGYSCAVNAIINRRILCGE